MHEIIHKDFKSVVDSNLRDHERSYDSFNWKSTHGLIDGMGEHVINIAYEAVDRHVVSGHGQRSAIRWLGKRGQEKTYTYGDLRLATNRFANVLRSLGIKKGDSIYTLLGRIPDLYVTALGTLKAGCVFCPMFSAFGPEPIQSRMEVGDAKVLVTTQALYKRKVAEIRNSLPSLEYILIVDAEESESTELLGMAALLEQASDKFDVEPTDAEDPALLHFTSGTTGKPKGAVHVHKAVVAHNITGQLALDLKVSDVYWCTADPGWVTGTSYGIIAPLTNGVTMVVDEAEIDAERWYRILQEQKVSVWYTAPTAIRMLMKAGDSIARKYDYSSLRFMACVGEPLNPEAGEWSQQVFGMPFHDNWWQTETGGIMIANYVSMDVKPGSMGKPLPGIHPGIVNKTPAGVVEVSQPSTIGELALRSGWPSMMQSYLHEPERYANCFVDGWYLTGDLAMRDRDGYYWFIGRYEDVIKSAGHLIGPFEVESALMEHEAVAEAAVIGVPDESAGEVVKAFVALKRNYTTSENLRLEIVGHARRRLGLAVAPKEIVFRDNLPKTRSGKILRRLLKARELGLPEGDVSTLKSDE